MLSQSIAALYPLIRPLLFCVDPETTHHVTLSALNQVYRLGGALGLRIPSISTFF